MKSIDCIKTRRSRRLFLNKDVPDDLLNKILDSAIYAPSSVDCQPWHFIVVKDKDVKERLAKQKTEGNEQHILTAPVTIVVCIDLEKSPVRFMADGVCASMNILLAVHDLGLGAVYVTGCNHTKPNVEVKLKEILSLPENIKPIAIIPIGYPDPSENLDEKNLVDLSERIHSDTF